MLQLYKKTPCPEAGLCSSLPSMQRPALTADLAKKRSAVFWGTFNWNFSCWTTGAVTMRSLLVSYRQWCCQAWYRTSRLTPEFPDCVWWPALQPERTRGWIPCSLSIDSFNCHAKILNISISLVLIFTLQVQWVSLNGTKLKRKLPEGKRVTKS